MKKILSKKGRAMSYCIRCKTNTVDVIKLGGIICSQCSIIKKYPK